MNINDAIAQALEADDDDGKTARSHLAAGQWISYVDPAYPDEIVREWPDGRREFVELDDQGRIVPVWELSPAPKRKRPRG